MSVMKDLGEKRGVSCSIQKFHTENIQVMIECVLNNEDRILISPYRDNEGKGIKEFSG